MTKRQIIKKAREEFEKSETPKIMLREAIIKQTPLIFTIKGLPETEMQAAKIDHKLEVIQSMYPYPFALVNVGYGDVYLLLAEGFTEPIELSQRLETLLANRYGKNGHLFVYDLDVADEESKKNKLIKDIAFEVYTSCEIISKYFAKETSIM